MLCRWGAGRLLAETVSPRCPCRMISRYDLSAFLDLVVIDFHMVSIWCANCFFSLFQVLCSAWKDDGTTVFSGGCDKQVKMWPLLSGGQPQTVAMHDAPVKEVAWIPQMNLLVSGSWDKTLRCARTVCCSKSSPFSLGSWINIVNWCSLMMLPMDVYYYRIECSLKGLVCSLSLWMFLIAFHPVYLSVLVFMPSIKLMVSYPRF